MMNVDLSCPPELDRLLDALRSEWPAHDKFIRKSFENRSADVIDTSERLAACVLRLAETVDGGLPRIAADYRFMCENIILPEEIFFRRNGRYRLSRFQDAVDECYANDALMNRYMNGLLLSSIVWDNHAHAFHHYVSRYLPGLRPGSAHLEIGPGHGLFIHFAGLSENVASLAGWDVSPTSIRNTRHALDALGTDRPVDLVVQDLFDAGSAEPGGNFDSIVMSEVLEHLEDPLAALNAMRPWLRDGGQMFINVPANSPAPDHIFLYHSLDHACEMVEQAGFTVTDQAAYPMTGATLEKAIKGKLSVSCVLTARKD